MNRVRQLFAIILLGSLWGPAFLLIKLAVAEVSPFTLVASRTAIGGLLLYLCLKLKRLRLPRAPMAWFHLFVASLMSATIPFTLFAFAELRISSALAGIANGLTPIATALLAHFCFSDERLNRSRGLGILLGSMGLVLLLLPELVQGAFSGDSLGLLAVSVASILYAGGIIYSRRFLSQYPPLANATGMLICAALGALPFALFIPVSAAHPLSWVGLSAILSLGVFVTAGAYYVYYRILEKSGATQLATSTYLLPIYGALLGTTCLKEQLCWHTYLAGGIILLGMMLVNETIQFRSRLKVEKE